MRIVLQLLSLILPMTLSFSALASDAWAGPFLISSIFVSPPGNYYFRVYGLPSQAALCPNGPTWAFVKLSDPGYQVYIASLMEAYATGTPVSVHVAGDSNGYCHIIELHT